MRYYITLLLLLSFLFSEGQSSSIPLFYKNDPAITNVYEVKIPDQYLKNFDFNNGLAPVRLADTISYKKSILIGFINNKGKLVVPARFDTIVRIAEPLIMVTENNRWGVIDLNGRYLIEPVYKQIEYTGNGSFKTLSFRRWEIRNASNQRLTVYEEDSLIPLRKDVMKYYNGKKFGLIVEQKKDQQLFEDIEDTPYDAVLVKDNGKYGLLDEYFKPLLPVKFDSIKFITKELIKVAVKKDTALLWGVLNRLAVPVIPVQYTALGNLSEEVIAVRNAERKWGYITLNNDTVVPFRYLKAEEFINSLAEAVNEKGNWEVVDRTGKIVVKDQFYEQYKADLYTFTDGGSNMKFVFPAGKFSYMKRTGNELIKIKEKGKFGIINEGGKYVIPAEYDSIRSYPEDSVFIAYKNNLARIFDVHGYPFLKIDQKFQKVFPFVDGRARVMIANRYGFIDNKGNVRVAPQYVSAQDFSEGRAAIMILDKWGFIDREENLLVQPFYSKVHPFMNGVARVMEKNKWLLINRSGKVINSATYDEIRPGGNCKWILISNNRYGLADSTGKEVLGPKYEGLKDLNNGYIIAQKYGKWGVLDHKENFIIPFEADGLAYDRFGGNFYVMTSGREEINKIDNSKKKK